MDFDFDKASYKFVFEKKLSQLKQMGFEYYATKKWNDKKNYEKNHETIKIKTKISNSKNVANFRKKQKIQKNKETLSSSNIQD